MFTTALLSRRNVQWNVVWLVFFIAAIGIARGQNLLDPADYQHYIERFNTMEPESVVKSIPNAQAWDWMKENIPFFECSSSKIVEIYYFRWWTFRKHFNIKDGYAGYIMTEFNSWESANSSAYCHHLAEGRWLHDETYLDEYTLFWYRHGGNLHKYSQWSTDALYKRYLELRSGVPHRFAG